MNAWPAVAVCSLFLSPILGAAPRYPLGAAPRYPLGAAPRYPFGASPRYSSEPAMTHHATGTFEVAVKPLGADGADWGAFARLSIDKQLRGGLEGHSVGQMLAEGGPAKAAGGYVALERVTGTLNGRRGSFALQHSGTMEGARSEMVITVVPGSGTEGLAGLAGTFHIRIEGKQHHYTFDYTLP